MSRPDKKSVQGFTLIELLVVVLILAILMAVALPLYLNAVADSQKKTCRSNMQTIANAVQAKYVQGAGATTYATIAAAGVTPANLPDLQAAPICPNAGTYTIVTTGTLNDSTGAANPVPATAYGISCSYTGPPAHGGFIPGVMSN